MIQSRTMRILRAVPLFLFWLALPAWQPATLRRQCSPPRLLPPSRYTSDEKVAIAVEPYDTREKAAIFRVDYLATG